MSDAIHLPHAPFLAGLVFRSLQGPTDAAALCAVHYARQERDQIDPLSTSEGLPLREQVEEMLSGVVAAGKEGNWLIAQVEGQVVGYTRLSGWAEVDGTWVYLILGWVVPAWRGQGIGTAMIHWAQERALYLASVDHLNTRCELAGNASSTEKEATALLLHEGYSVAYTVLEMALDPAMPVPVYPLPAGIELHPAQPEHYPLIAASVQEAYQNESPGGRYTEVFNPAEFIGYLDEPRHDPTLWRIAWAGDQVAGQVLPIYEKGRAEIFEVSIRPAWRRHGLARALLSRAIDELCRRGMEPIRLRTNANFPTRAQDLYRGLGFRVMKEFPRYRKGIP